MYEFQYDYIKLKHDMKTKLWYIDTDRFIIYIKTDDSHKFNTDVKTRFGTLIYELTKLTK